MQFNKFYLLLLSSFTLPAFALPSTEVIKQLQQNAAHHRVIKQAQPSPHSFQWKLWSKPDNGKTYLQTHQIPHSNTLFAYYYNPFNKSYLLRSLDGGLSWSRLDTIRNIRELVNIDEHTLLAVNNHVMDKGVYISKDQGEHWSFSNKGIQSYLSHAYVVDPQILFVSNADDNQPSYSANIYRSMNGGASWAPVLLGLNTYHGLYAFNARNNLTVAIQNTSDYSVNELYVSTHYGDNWKKIKTIDSSVWHPFILITSNNEIFIQSGLDLYQTNVAGSYWIKIKLDFLNSDFIDSIHNIKIDDKDRLYLSVNGKNENRLYRSDNHASHWELLTSPSDRIRDFTLLDTGKILLSTEDGLFLSDISQKNYTKLFDDDYVYMDELFVKDNTAYFWDSGSQPILYRSLDSGKTWAKSYQKKDYYSSPLINFNDKLFTTDGHTILVNDEKNSTWKKIYTFPDTEFRPNLYRDGDQLIAYGRRGAYVTTDLADWEKIANHAVRSIYKNNQFIYTTDRFSIMKSSDAGKDWETIFDIPADDKTMEPNYEIDMLRGVGNTLLAAISGAGIIKSIDGGNDWQIINEGIEDWNFNSLITINEKVYVLATSYNIYLTIDGGNHWQLASKEFNDNYINTLVLDNGSLYAAVDSLGIFKTKMS